MTTPTTRRRGRRPAAPAVPLPTVPARGARGPAPSRPRGGAGCCRTWSSEHLSLSGSVVRTTWHEPACKARSRP
ncbi:hypothetical protein [Kitasatospora sp. NPDC094015]|uniref:hypothetical protein n=1 Tax=Kitasatospora sp. NPDC094015 TaxID=3155205 RepID=UPI00332D7901